MKEREIEWREIERVDEFWLCCAKAARKKIKYWMTTPVENYVDPNTLYCLFELCRVQYRIYPSPEDPNNDWSQYKERLCGIIQFEDGLIVYFLNLETLFVRKIISNLWSK